MGYVEGTPPLTPIFNIIGLIVKTRNNVTKVRTILDTKQSGIKKMTTKTERITLPRLFDAILRLLFLMAAMNTPDVAVNAFVLDFSDAYWQLPLRDDERKYFCATAKIRGKRKYLSFLRAPQGSTNSGLLWGRLAALIMRLTQSLFHESEVNLMCYVDDPLAALMGTPAVRRRNAALMVLVWEALGFKLAYAKGQLDSEVTWIGGTMRAEPGGVRAWIKESLVSDIKIELSRLMASNIISHKDLHSLVGKLGHASGLLIVMRPFLDPLWAALYSRDSKGAPSNTVWTKQIAVTLHWFQAFFTSGGNKIERFFSSEAYGRTGPIIEIGTDASPWGMGGWLSIDGTIKHFFACRLTEDDARIFDEKLDGSCVGQQLWECLAILVAVDIWSKEWSESRVVLKIRGDNVGALFLVVKMRPANAKQAIIARELALRFVELSFPPDAIHTPGIAHVAADELSRVYAPKGSGIVNNSIHPSLRHATQTVVPPRNEAWYRALQ